MGQYAEGRFDNGLNCPENYTMSLLMRKQMRLEGVIFIKQDFYSCMTKLHILLNRQSLKVSKNHNPDLHPGHL